jgi:transposase-like protein
MDRVSEIISSVERRRKWTAEQKVKMLTEVLEPGATVSSVADRNGISRSQLYAWKRLAQRGSIPGIAVNGRLTGQAPGRARRICADPRDAQRACAADRLTAQTLATPHA